MDPTREADPRVAREWFLLTFLPSWRSLPRGTGYTEYACVPRLGDLLSPGRSPSMRELLEESAGALAGPVAEARWRHLTEHAAALEMLGGSSGLMRRAERLARGLVEEKWDQIVRMAQIRRES